MSNTEVLISSHSKHSFRDTALPPHCITEPLLLTYHSCLASEALHVEGDHLKILFPLHKQNKFIHLLQEWPFREQTQLKPLFPSLKITPQHSPLYPSLQYSLHGNSIYSAPKAPSSVTGRAQASCIVFAGCCSFNSTSCIHLCILHITIPKKPSLTSFLGGGNGKARRGSLGTAQPLWRRGEAGGSAPAAGRQPGPSTGAHRQRAPSPAPASPSISHISSLAFSHTLALTEDPDARSCHFSLFSNQP